MSARRKLVGYAYPTSTIAGRLGFSKTGCWFSGSDQAGEKNHLKADVGFRSWDEAESVAAKVDLPWSPWTMPRPALG